MLCSSMFVDFFDYEADDGGKVCGASRTDKTGRNERGRPVSMKNAGKVKRASGQATESISQEAKKARDGRAVRRRVKDDATNIITKRWEENLGNTRKKKRK
jgi:hypothetical protein